MFLSMEGLSIYCKVTGPREYSRDLRQGGLHVPCILEIRGNKVNVENVMDTIQKQREHRKKIGLPSDVEDELNAANNATATPRTTPTVSIDTEVTASVQNIVLLSCSSTTEVEVTDLDATLKGGVEEPHKSDKLRINMKQVQKQHGTDECTNCFCSFTSKKSGSSKFG